MSGTDTAACLRRLPVSTILADQNPVGYTPDIDGAVLTQSIKTALASGQFNRVPVIIGTNHDEYRLFVAGFQFLGEQVTAANYQSMIASTLGVAPAMASKIAAQYPLSRYPSPPVALGAVGTDAIFACHALTAEESLSRYVPVYAYEFNDENAPELFLPPVGFPYGAAHASELPYLFSQATIAQPGTVHPGSAAARGGHEAGLDEPGQDRGPGLRMAAVQRRQPADAVPGTAAPADRDGLRRPAPLRVLGARTLASPTAR